MARKKSKRKNRIESPRMLAFKAERDKYRLCQIMARRCDPEIVVMAYTGLNEKSLPFGHGLARMEDIRVSMMIPMNRSLAPLFLDAPLVKRGCRLLPHRHHVQHLSCVRNGDDLRFGGQDSLVGDPKDACKIPRISSEGLENYDTIHSKAEMDLVKEMLKAWVTLGAKVNSDPSSTHLRRMVRLPDKSLLDDWEPNDAWMNDLIIQAQFKEFGISLFDREAHFGIFTHFYTVDPGQRGFEDSGVLVDWRFIGEGLRSKAEGSEWGAFDHMPCVQQEHIGNGYISVEKFTGYSQGQDKEAWRRDQDLRFCNGVCYDRTPLFAPERVIIPYAEQAGRSAPSRVQPRKVGHGPALPSKDDFDDEIERARMEPRTDLPRPRQVYRKRSKAVC
jgi:hypothetical protein